jgi:hypothetical protein
MGDDRLVRSFRDFWHGAVKLALRCIQETLPKIRQTLSVHVLEIGEMGRTPGSVCNLTAISSGPDRKRVSSTGNIQTANDNQ